MGLEQLRLCYSQKHLQLLLLVCLPCLLLQQGWLGSACLQMVT
jgi:hypothetical protein